MNSKPEPPNEGDLPELDETTVRKNTDAGDQQELDRQANLPEFRTAPSEGDGFHAATQAAEQLGGPEKSARTTSVAADVTQPNSYQSSLEILKAGQRNGERYLLGDEIARGGMGAIIRGHDRLLGRELAIKVMLAGGTSDPSLIRRFVDEAQICGQLQHPGITPVHDIGTLGDSHPFFAMKLIKGETLADQLRKRTSPKSDLSNFLGIFESICQTIAFAHSKFVIHRDLKPANVMVGSFGEVQVMDWGLAKVLRPEGDSDTRSLDVSKIEPVGSLPASSGQSADFTQAGSVMGTIAYMSPEQAAGNIEELDARADVFALGAILAEILTGQPIYLAQDFAGLHRMAIEGDLSDCFKRLEQSECDAELVALVRDCLCVDRDDRLTSGFEVALRLKNYQDSVAERLRQAELDRVAAAAKAIEATKTAAAERGRRRLSVAISGLVLLFIAAAAMGIFLVQQNRHRAEVAEGNVELEQRKVELQKLKQDEENRLRLEQVRRQLVEELAIGESQLKEIEGEQAPTILTIDRVIESASRANLLAKKSDPSTELTARQKALEDRAIELQADFDFTVGLEDCWATEIGGRFLNQGNLVFTSESPTPIAVVDNSTAVLRLHAVIEDWLDRIKLSNQPDKLTNRILRMPPWAKATVISSLHRFVDAAQSSNFAEAIVDQSWFTPTAKSAVSLGGAQLNRQEDGSYLATGENPPGDKYEMIFALTDSDWNSIRLEALPDRSNQGFLGRGRGGHAAVIGITVEVARENDLSRIVEIPITSAKADYCFAEVPLWVGGWNLTNAGTAAKTFVGCLASTADEALVAAESKAMLSESRSGNPILARVRIQFNTAPECNDQNLGRFRISFGRLAAQQNIARVSDIVGKAIRDVVSDPWQKRLCEAMQNDDVEMMLNLAKDETAAAQPAGYVIWLADQLFDLGEVYYADRVNRACSWVTLKPRTMNARSAELELQDDLSIVSQVDAYVDTYDLRYDQLDQNRIPKMFRLETFAPAVAGTDGKTANINVGRLSEIKIYLRYEESGLFELRDVVSTASNHEQKLRGRVNLATDGDTTTVWEVIHPAGRAKCTSLFKLDVSPLVKFGGQAIVQLNNGQFLFSDSSTLKKFRISWTNDDVAKFDDPRMIAFKLLQDVHLKSPSDFRVLLALSRNAVMKPLPDFDVAMEYATAAIASRPNHPVAIDSFVSLTLLKDPVPGSDAYLRGFELAKRADGSGAVPRSIRRLVEYNTEYADRAFSGGEFVAAAKAFEALFDLSPETFWDYDLWGMSLVNSGRLQEAEEIFLRGLERQPDYAYIHVHYSAGLIRMGRLAEARQQVRRSLELEPTNITGLERMAEVEMLLGNHREACKYWEQFFQRYPTRTTMAARLRYGSALAEADRLNDSLEILGSKLEQDAIGNADFMLTYCQVLNHLNRDDEVIPKLQGLLDQGIFKLSDLFMAVLRRAIGDDDSSRFAYGTKVEYGFFSAEFLVPIIEHCVAQATGLEKKQCLEIQAIVALRCDDLEFAERSIDLLPSDEDSFFCSAGFIKAAAVFAKGEQKKAGEWVEAAEKIADRSLRQESYLVLDYVKSHAAVAKAIGLSKERP